MADITFDQLVRMLNKSMAYLAQIDAYQKNWDGDFSKSQVLDVFEKLYENAPIDLKKFSLKELQTLGFSWWDEEETLLLIPLHAYRLIADGTVLHSIDGGSYIKGKDEIDLDHRFGMLAYGFMFDRKDLKLAMTDLPMKRGDFEPNLFGGSPNGV